MFRQTVSGKNRPLTLERSFEEESRICFRTGQNPTLPIAVYQQSEALDTLDRVLATKRGQSFHKIHLVLRLFCEA